jgi:hypothetical protein
MSKVVKEVIKPSNKENDKNIIRKLGIIETYFHNEIENGSSINASTIKISSKVDLFQNFEFFNKAVRLWKKTQPLLRSRVVYLDESDNQTKSQKKNSNHKNQFNKYFAYVNQDDDDSKNYERLSNVNYLYFKSSSNKNDDCGDLWKLLIEREISIPIDWENGPMWRLTLISLNREKNESDLYEYCLIITVSHAIFDGTSAFVSLVSLFNILEYLFVNQADHESINEHLIDAKVIEPVEACAMNHLEKTNISYEQLADYKKIGGFKRPSSFIINNENERTQYIPIEKLEDNPDRIKLGGFYSALNDALIINLDSLLEISKNSVTKFYLSVFEGDKYEKFLTICKSNNAKITGVFNTIFIIAWRMTYKKFSANLIDHHDGILNEKIHYLTIVNLRSFVKDIDLSSLVWFCNNLYNSYDESFNTKEVDFWHSKFWKFARQESEMFHDRLKRGEQFKLLESSTPIHQDETRLHYGLSNLVVPNELTKDIKLFKINELFTLTSYRKDW